MDTKYQSMIKQIKEYAAVNKIPIMQDEGIDYLTTFIIKNNIDSVLEVGTAIGYSAIMMAKEKEDLEIITIEKDEKRYREALKNIKTCELDKRIEVVFNDALETNFSGYKFDMIFIDASKGQYIKYFDKFKYYLSDGGVIITDNLKFHGLVENKDMIESKNVQGIVDKIEKYIDYLKDNDEFVTKFFDVGDGLSVSYKNNNANVQGIN